MLLKLNNTIYNATINDNGTITLVYDNIEVETYKYKLSVSTPTDCIPLIQKIANKQQENFMVIALNSAHQIIKSKVIFKGTVNYCIVHNRDIFNFLIKNNATSFIIAHNHPSGSLKPSEQDIKMTKEVLNASKIMGINLLDHIIISKDGFYSFCEETNNFNDF